MTHAAPPADSPDPDEAARASLRRHKAVATGLVAGMAGLTVATYWLPPSFAASTLQAAAKAGFVGGIADWFAVTALFRHPLGLPIPHTAIIPTQKARLGRALGRFVGNHVFTGAEVARTLEKLDLAGIIARSLSDPATARPAAQALAATLPKLLGSVEDGRARKVLTRIIPRMLGGPEAGRLIGRALRQLVEGGRHQEVFGYVMSQVKTLLIAREEAIRAAIQDRVREQGGRLVGWALGATVATRMLGVINAELEKMEADQSELRAAFDEWVRREIARIEEDPARAAEIGAALRQVVAHETVRAWFWDVWSRMRIAFETDAARPTGRTVAFLEEAVSNLGTLLATDPAAHARLQATLHGLIGGLIPAGQVKIADFVSDVVAGWDSKTITDRLELRIGPDLQYVRINGTIVGFIVGGLAYAVLHAIFGPTAF
jgi:uncharacterized membrane-anchored protein YjiN (DUF445 family)